MIAVRPDPKLIGPIRDALRARRCSLPAVSADSAGGPSSGAPASSSASEQSLRRLMVNHYPRMKRHKRLDGGAFASAIAAVAAKADWSDMRHIDALNALYEVWHDDHMPDLRDLFVQHYREALTRMLLD